MVMRALHEGPSKGYFVTKIMHRKILAVGYCGQLCINMYIIIENLVMHAKEQEDWQIKVLQS
jgi:hypothetical protein